MTNATLTGSLLVASPELAGSAFSQAVVLLLDHDEAGALGVVVNHPTPVDVGDILPTWQPFASGPGVVFQGGPVALDSALGLAAVDDGVEPIGWRRVLDGLGLVDLDTPPELFAGELGAMRIFAGYAGWGPSQLESELAQASWFVVDAEPGDAFTTDPTTLWRRVLRRQGGDLAFLSTWTEDPTLN